jgi:hypothetical protein
VQLGGCGDPGEYIHLTPDYVMNFDSEFNIFEFGPAGCASFVFYLFHVHSYHVKLTLNCRQGYCQRMGSTALRSV